MNMENNTKFFVIIILIAIVIASVTVYLTDKRNEQLNETEEIVKKILNEQPNISISEKIIVITNSCNNFVSIDTVFCKRKLMNEFVFER